MIKHYRDPNTLLTEAAPAGLSAEQIQKAIELKLLDPAAIKGMSPDQINSAISLGKIGPYAPKKADDGGPGLGTAAAGVGAAGLATGGAVLTGRAALAAKNAVSKSAFAPGRDISDLTPHQMARANAVKSGRAAKAFKGSFAKDLNVVAPIKSAAAGIKARAGNKWGALLATAREILAKKKAAAPSINGGNGALSSSRSSAALGHDRGLDTPKFVSPVDNRNIPITITPTDSQAVDMVKTKINSNRL